ncbi:uncharacterized protein [Watersipora subatra]|uniref:uncharacterized protein isoform X2 n=1 Tax=Watersipora subatra TaxID=2589382 RepID=UPI00355B3961
MGNVSEHHHYSDIEDGEEVYETLARDISYLRCVSEEKNPTINQRNRRQSLRRAASRKRSIRRLQSTRASWKESQAGAFLISDLEVQVDGKHAILVPRKSVLEKKGLAKLKSKMAFISNRRSTKKSKLRGQSQPPCGDNISANQVEKDKFHAKTKLVENHEKGRLTKTTSHYFVIQTSKGNHRLRPVSVHENVNIINKSGNMALNLEKARLRKLASLELEKDS